MRAGRDASTVSGARVLALSLGLAWGGHLAARFAGLAEPGDVERILGLAPAFGPGRRAWQTLTYAFVHHELPLQVGVHVLLLWIAGRPLEARIGRRGLLLLFATSTVLAGATGTVASLASSAGAAPMLGAAAGVIAIAVAAARFQPQCRLPLLFLDAPAPAAALVYTLVVFFLLVSAKQSPAAAIGHVGGGVLVGLAWQRGLAPSRSRAGRAPTRRRSGVAPEDPRELEVRLDDVLRKIKAVGLASLTAEERALLDRASRHFRRELGRR